MNKRLLLSIIFSILSLVFSSHFIYSPVFAENPADIEIIETSLDGSGGIVPWQDITDAMPGETYDLSPSVINNGTDPVEVSICITQSGKNSSGSPITIPNNTFEINFNPGWTKEPGANCYDYDLVLDTGSTTTSLFDRVTISSTIGNEYQNATFNLVLTATAISGEPDIPEPEPVNPEPSTPEQEISSPESPNTGFTTFISSALPTISIIAVVVALAIIIIFRKNTKA